MDKLFFLYKNLSNRTWRYNIYFHIFIVFVFCLGFHVKLANFSMKWRRHHYRWRSPTFDLYTVIFAVDHLAFFSMIHLHVLWHGSTVYKVVSKDPWHSHLLASVRQWSCHFLFLRLNVPCHGRYYTLKNPNVSMAMSAEHRSKLAAIYR